MKAPSPENLDRVRRFGQVIELKAEKAAEYRALHEAVWPSVLKTIKDVHIRNYSIFLKEALPGTIFLFAYFEYTGDDFAADKARMAADPETRRWWELTDPCQRPVPGSAGGEWWSAMDEVFHLD